MGCRLSMSYDDFPMWNDTFCVSRGGICVDRVEIRISASDRTRADYVDILPLLRLQSQATTTITFEIVDEYNEDIWSAPIQRGLARDLKEFLQVSSIYDPLKTIYNSPQITSLQVSLQTMAMRVQHSRNIGDGLINLSNAGDLEKHLQDIIRQLFFPWNVQCQVLEDIDDSRVD